MRDIRSDLRERAAIIGEHVKAAQAQFETVLEQIRREHEGKIKDLRAELDAVNVLLGIEQRRHDASTQAPPHALPQPQPQGQAQGAKSRPLSGILMRRAG
jgi:hypothetical protein